MGLSKKGRYVYCADCGCRLEMNGICKICGHADNPLLPGMVPELTGLTQNGASMALAGPECQLVLGDVTTENSDTVEVDKIISSDPVAGVQLKKKAKVHIVVSLGPTA